jgi:cytochrome c556
MFRVWILGITAGALMASAGHLNAADEPANVIKYRQSTMKAISGHMGALGAMAKGEVSFTDEAFGHAHAVHQLSQGLERYFPAGTAKGEVDGVETRALPAIWEQNDKFQQAIEQIQAESKKLADMSEGGEFEQAAFAQQVGALGKQGCGNCHETFREKQD